MEKDKDHGDVGVLLGRGHDVEVVPPDESKGALLGLEQGCQRSVLLLVHHQADELVDGVVLDVAPVVPVDQHLALHVKDVNAGQNHLFSRFSARWQFSSPGRNFKQT